MPTRISGTAITGQVDSSIQGAVAMPMATCSRLTPFIKPLPQILH